jgi:heme A synthase
MSIKRFIVAGVLAPALAAGTLVGTNQAAFASDTSTQIVAQKAAPGSADPQFWAAVGQAAANAAAAAVAGAVAGVVVAAAIAPKSSSSSSGGPANGKQSSSNAGDAAFDVAG